MLFTRGFCQTWYALCSSSGSVFEAHGAVQTQLEYFEAIDGEEAYERNSEDLYAGGGQYRRAVERTPIEHFPQLWCNNGSYSVYGQVGLLQSIKRSTGESNTLSGVDRRGTWKL